MKDSRSRIQRLDFSSNIFQYLVLSIDNSESFGRSVSGRAVLARDMPAGVGYHPQLQLWSLEAIQRQRTRPKWHDEYLHLEDACWALFVSDIGMRLVQQYRCTSRRGYRNNMPVAD